MKGVKSRLVAPLLKRLSPGGKGTTRNERFAELHSQNRFMEASSNLVNLFEINSISVYELKAEYEKLKSKTLCEY